MTMQGSAVAVPGIRRAVRGELDTLGSLIGESFMDDPVSCWVFPDEEYRRTAQPRFFGVYLDAALSDGWVDVVDDLSAVAVWLPVAAGDGGGHGAGGDVSVEGGEGGEGGQGGEAGDELGERLCAAVPGNERARIVGELTGQVHPTDRAHYYLPAVVAAPGRRGQGRGHALLGPVLDRCDREGTPAYLEASNERSKALYERLGFVTTGGPVRLPDGPSLWPMWREPRP
jgi:GNAT superfamily N-acetyltransferase